MQEKFLKLEKNQQKKLLKLIHKERGNLTAICTVSELNIKTVKTIAAGMRGKQSSIEKLTKLIENV